MANSIEYSSPFIKQLASNDRRSRDKGVDTLRSYLRSRGAKLDNLEMLKLWKGLFYCMWMSDKPRTQQQLARDLASLVEVLSAETVLLFLDAFWKTMAREWVGIDVLRMDKFLYLVRVYLYASFRHFSHRGWRDTEGLDAYIDILSATPLDARDTKIPNGLRYHVIDIYVDELARLWEGGKDKMPTEVLLRPLRNLGKKSLTKTIRERVKEALEDERLKEILGDDADEQTAQNPTEKPTPAKSTGNSEDEDDWVGIED